MILNKLADLILPVGCSCCGEKQVTKDESYICPGCRNTLEIINSCGCLYCGRPIGRGVYCGRCGSYSSGITKFYISSIYGGKIRNLITDFKFNNKRYLYKVLGDIAAETIMIQALDKDIRILPVPLHPSRKRERGYNQSELIAQRAARLTGMSLERNALKRKTRTLPQSTLGKTERNRNIVGAFKANQKARGKKFLILDDVSTTGSTIRACASALKDAGAGDIFALAIAHGR